MKVNQNISAVISNAQLHRTEDKLSASIQRLSSGFKLNKAKDNPAGMAISGGRNERLADGRWRVKRNPCDAAAHARIVRTVRD